MKAVIGKYFTKEKDAIKYTKEQQKEWKKEFVILKSYCYLVISKKQLE